MYIKKYYRELTQQSTAPFFRPCNLIKYMLFYARVLIDSVKPDWKRNNIIYLAAASKIPYICNCIIIRISHLAAGYGVHSFVHGGHRLHDLQPPGLHPGPLLHVREEAQDTVSTRARECDRLMLLLQPLQKLWYIYYIAHLVLYVPLAIVQVV